MKKILKPNYVVVVVAILYSVVALWALGSTKAPQTFYTATSEDYFFTVEFEDSVNLGSIWTYSGHGDYFSEPVGQKVLGQFEVFVSENGKDFQVIRDIDHTSVYTWQKNTVYTKQYSEGIKAVRVRAKYVNDTLYEIAFYDTEGNLLKGNLVSGNSQNPYGTQFVYDEQDTVPANTGYFNSMYFDEIYHARTAFEQLKGYEIYETTHPPLGKILISIGIAMFGMTPFGWRIVGALCGVAMIPVMYLFVDVLCKNKKVACFAAILLSLDFMHLTQTRIATVDTYVVLFVLLTFLFMARWHNTSWGNQKGFINLALSGVFMGCAVSSKWNGAYPMVGLAAMFFISFISKYRSSTKSLADKKQLVKILGLCCAFFVVVPIIIYTVSFIPVIKGENLSDYVKQLWDYQKHMYGFHTTLEAEHLFSSSWYTWPLCLKPIWYSIAQNAETASSISALGNPAIWVFTPIAALYCLYQGIKNKRTSHLFASLGWFSAYLPWMMITRMSFIYHYFPCAVFGIVAISLMIMDICNKYKNAEKLVSIYTLLCFSLFVMFIPITTGLEAPIEYIEFLEFLPDWEFLTDRYFMTDWLWDVI